VTRAVTRDYAVGGPAAGALGGLIGTLVAAGIDVTRDFVELGDFESDGSFFLIGALAALEGYDDATALSHGLALADLDGDYTGVGHVLQDVVAILGVDPVLVVQQLAQLDAGTVSTLATLLHDGGHASGGRPAADEHQHDGDPLRGRSAPRCGGLRRAGRDDRPGARQQQQPARGRPLGGGRRGVRPLTASRDAPRPPDRALRHTCQTHDALSPDLRLLELGGSGRPGHR
jgi:hypothetical protein